MKIFDFRAFIPAHVQCSKQQPIEFGLLFYCRGGAKHDSRQWTSVFSAKLLGP